MKFDELEELESKYYSNVFARFPVAIIKGRGVDVWDINGKKYLDMFSGISVNNIGHCHPKVVSAIKKQAETLIHISNWLYTAPQIKLAEKLTTLTKQEKVFLTNDGTEAVETAIKLARKATSKGEIIAMENAFHGRTMGSLSLTWGEKYRKPFEPLLPNTKFVPYNDVDSISDAITDNTAAVIVEPIQGEVGVYVPDDNYLKALRDLTSDKGVLLIVDEIQTGFGRTGYMFAHEKYKIKPDILCLSKALGSGMPIGATLFSGFDFEQGEHGGTLVGNPIACAAALSTLDVIESEGLVANCKKMGDLFSLRLNEENIEHRGLGLMIGIAVNNPKAAVADLIGEGILSIYSKETLRVLPPLIIDETHIERFIIALKKVIT